jgi:hypothetical protein
MLLASSTTGFCSLRPALEYCVAIVTVCVLGSFLADAIGDLTHDLTVHEEIKGSPTVVCTVQKAEWMEEYIFMRESGHLKRECKIQLVASVDDAVVESTVRTTLLNCSAVETDGVTRCAIMEKNGVEGSHVLYPIMLLELEMRSLWAFLPRMFSIFFLFCFYFFMLAWKTIFGVINFNKHIHGQMAYQRSTDRDSMDLEVFGSQITTVRNEYDRRAQEIIDGKESDGVT